jgi:hypothetical protein
MRILKVLLVVLFIVPPQILANPLQNADIRPWWNIKMTVKVRGEYRLESREARYEGSYAFTIVWTGAMQKDDGDYLLYHNTCELSHWAAEEKAVTSESVKLLTTKDFMVKPELKVNYILRKEDGLYIDFVVVGFDVPQSASSESFYLNFPASKENAANLANASYDLHIKKGSNKIVLEEKSLLKATEKAFSWTWKYQDWLQKADKNVFHSNSHNVQVKVAISPGK